MICYYSILVQQFQRKHMEIIMAFFTIFGALGLFFLALLIIHPAGKFIATRLDTWPDRPMDNQERKAAWALKYHQATPLQPNRFNWRWLPESQATFNREFMRLLMKCKGPQRFEIPPSPDHDDCQVYFTFDKGNDNE